MRFFRYMAAAMVATIVAVSGAGPASAHNALVEATPKKGAVLKKAPERVELTFLQALDQRYLTIAVTGAGKQPVAADPPEADGKKGTLAFADPLPNGDYTVAYRVVSKDGHPVQGSYAFTVQDPSATASPATASTPSAPASPAAPAAVPSSEVLRKSLEAEDPAPWWPIAAGVAGVLLLGAGAVVLARRRR